MEEEFKEDNMEIKNGPKRELPMDKSEEIEYKSEDFCKVFSDLASAFIDRDLSAIHTLMSILYTITLHAKNLRVAEFGELNVQQFFFDFFNTFECKDIFPEGLRILNYLISEPDFELQILESEEFLETLLTEVRPHLKYQSTALEVMKNILQDNADARQNFLDNENDNLNFLAGIYDDFKGNTLIQESIISIYRAIITTDPCLMDEIIMPIIVFVQNRCGQEELFTEEMALLLYDIIKTDDDYESKMYSDLNTHLLFAYLITKPKNIQLIICDILMIICDKSKTYFASDFFWPSVINPLMIIEDDEIRCKLLELSEILLFAQPVNSYSAFDYAMYDMIMNFAKNGTYKVRFECVRILANMVVNSQLPLITEVLLIGGYFETISSFIESELRDIIFNSILVITNKINSNPQFAQYVFPSSEFIQDFVEDNSEYTFKENTILSFYVITIEMARELGIKPYKQRSEEEDEEEEEINKEEEEKGKINPHSRSTFIKEAYKVIAMENGLPYDRKSFKKCMTPGDDVPIVPLIIEEEESDGD